MAPCCRQENVTGVNRLVKMSPYGKGGSLIERQGTATGDGVERGGTRQSLRVGICSPDIRSSAPTIYSGSWAVTPECQKYDETLPFHPIY